MKIVVMSIGKQHDVLFKEAIQTFTNRLNNYFNTEWCIIAPPKNAASLSIADAKKIEATLIQQQLLKEDYVVLLDERGKQYSSPQLAQFIQQRANESCKRLVFIIGGAYGVEEILFKQANVVQSLSQLVFPHMMVRLIVSEQLYRACTILRNEKYHHT